MRALALAVVLACAVLAPTCSAQSPAEMYAALPHLGATQPLRPGLYWGHIFSAFAALSAQFQ